MKPKFIPLLLLAFINVICTAQNRLININTKGMVLVNQGTFFMGLDSAQLKADMEHYNLPADFFSQEYPALRVTVFSFYIDKYEVTNADYKKFIKANPQWSKANIPDSLHNGDYLKDWNGDNYPKGKADNPVVYVSFYAANAYAGWMHKRLPSHAEMEYAARGTLQESVDFPWGNNNADKEKANYLLSGIGQTTKVGAYAPNTLGLYDMAGNVFEFCADRWHQDDYAKMKQFTIDKRYDIFNFPNADFSTVVICGGSWNDKAVKLRVTYRQKMTVTDCSPYVGFRCAYNVPQYKSVR